MHHISVQIINDTDSDESFDDLEAFMDDDVGDKDVFRQAWSHKNIYAHPSDEEPPKDGEALNTVVEAYEHVCAAVSDLRILKNIVQSNLTKKNFAMTKIPEENRTAADPDLIAFENFTTRKKQLEECSNFLTNSAESLRSQILGTRQYFRDVEELSKRFPLKLVQTQQNETKVAIDTSIPTNDSIFLNEKTQQNDDEPSIEWKLSVPTYFSFNSHSFDLQTQSQYVCCFFQLMCHQLFERIKDDQIKSAIHYSADKETRSVYFDIGSKETWIFELGKHKSPAQIPVWIPRLIHYIIDPKAQPATFMKQLLYFNSTFAAIKSALVNRFMSSDFCSLMLKSHPCVCAYQVSSPYLTLPYIAFIDKYRVSLTETPNEMRCIPYSTDGRGLTPALDKWCDISYATLFLSMAEKITRSFGYVFKNKNQYGTAAIGGKKIKFKPMPRSCDVEISITSHSTKTFQWKNIPGSDYFERMCVVLFTDL